MHRSMVQVKCIHCNRTSTVTLVDTSWTPSQQMEHLRNLSTKVNRTLCEVRRAVSPEVASEHAVPSMKHPKVPAAPLPPVPMAAAPVIAECVRPAIPAIAQAESGLAAGALPTVVPKVVAAKPSCSPSPIPAIVPAKAGLLAGALPAVVPKVVAPKPSCSSLPFVPPVRFLTAPSFKSIMKQAGKTNSRALNYLLICARRY